MNIKSLIGEATEYDKKLTLEEKRPKSWLKSVSAFANGIGGVLIFGVSDDEQWIGLDNAHNFAEKISETIKSKMDPIPQIVLKIQQENGKDFVLSFGLMNDDKVLTNAGALLADDSPIYQSRLFCTHWYGLDKASGVMEAIDDKEYRGSLVTLLQNGTDFIKNNTKKRWKKTDDILKPVVKFILTFMMTVWKSIPPVACMQGHLYKTLTLTMCPPNAVILSLLISLTA
ncbi:helix-turn-helix domain-containing protein [Ruminococcus sp. 5_1_39BFAA]|uniref:AlbA family DNA-binding domain-containing protein n=1 Tax=Ruminococcus sp. 5_1_39BFAA TaxID=457412 RepID=UPI00356795AF